MHTHAHAWKIWEGKQPHEQMPQRVEWRHRGCPAVGSLLVHLTACLKSCSITYYCEHGTFMQTHHYTPVVSAWGRVLSHSTTDILDQVVLCRRGSPVHSRLFSSIEGSYPLDANSSPTPSGDDKIMPPDSAQCPLGKGRLLCN